MTLLRIYDLDEARRSILQRVPPDEFDVPPSLQQGIAAIFGEALSPEEAVRRVIRDVRTRGDEAARDWTHRIDRVLLDDLAVSPDDIERAYAATEPKVIAALN